MRHWGCVAWPEGKSFMEFSRDGPAAAVHCGTPASQARGGQPGRLRAGLRAAVAPLAAPRAAVLLAPVLRALAAGFFFWAEAAPSGAVAALREPVFTDC